MHWSGVIDLFDTAFVDLEEKIKLRPQSKPQFNWLFPKCIATKLNVGSETHHLKSRLDDRPNLQQFDFFTMNDRSGEQIWNNIEHILKALGDTKKPIRGESGRNSEDMSLRLLSVTSVPYSKPIKRGKHWYLAGAACLEPLVIDIYREALLRTPAGVCHEEIEAVLSSFTAQGKWQYVDWCKVPSNVAGKDEAVSRALRAEAYQERLDLESIQQIVHYIENQGVTKALDESKIDFGVSTAVKTLVKVIFTFCFCSSPVGLMYLWTHRSCKTMLLVADSERTQQNQMIIFGETAHGLIPSTASQCGTNALRIQKWYA